MFFNNFDRLRRKHLRRIDGDNGHFRKVYRIQTKAFGKDNMGKVVKVARQQKALRANSAEFQIWMTVSGTNLEQYFCPIRSRSEDYEFIVMDYAKPNNITYEEKKEFGDELTSKAPGLSVPVEEQKGLDITPRNIGIHDDYGRVMIDYPWGADWTEKVE